MSSTRKTIRDTWGTSMISRRKTLARICVGLVFGANLTWGAGFPLLHRTMRLVIAFGASQNLMASTGASISDQRDLRRRLAKRASTVAPKVATSPSKQRQTLVGVFTYYFYYLVLLWVFFLTSIYKNIQYVYRRMRLKVLNLTYHPSRSPQIIRDDVTKLVKLPRRVAAILDLRDDDDENGGVDGLISDISELAAWLVLAGVPHLTIYEHDGVVKLHITALVRYVSKNLRLYFGTDSIPTFAVRVPHTNTTVYSHPTLGTNVDLTISVLSRIDGKPTILELTKTMSELAANKELSIKDISVELVDEELVELVGPEPDLLICFGPSLDLQNFPPWHIRLTEIYWEPGNTDVNYAVYIAALQQYSRCEMKVGK